MDQEDLKYEYTERFGRRPEYVYFCPGRVNLIGEHIDYNGGQVMPLAISSGTYLAVAKNTDKRLRFQCLNFPESVELHLQSSYSKTGNEWFNYPLGVIDRVLQDGHGISGMDMLYYGNLPIGAGLSSSASIEVLTAFAISDMFGLDLSKKEQAVLCKEAENNFMGVNCGIMDQFAVAMGKKDKVILLNCDTLGYEYLPFETGPFSLMIINTNKPRLLAESKYNERFAECGAALKLLKQELPVQTLCDISVADFDRYRYLLGNPVLEKRALHVISENQRVKDAVIALQTNDLEILGKLMIASHNSLRDHYEVTGRELDTIVELSMSFPGCIGARMTGAGFGGCAIALVKSAGLEEFQSMLTENYQKKIGYPPSFLVTSAENGVRAL